MRQLRSLSAPQRRRLTARAPQLTISSSRVGMGVTGGNPYGFDLGTKAGTPGGPFIEGMNEGVLGMQIGGQRKIIGAFAKQA